MKTNNYLTLILLVFSTSTIAQNYTDYVGAGHSDGIVVTSCNEQSRAFWNETASGDNTINGNGLDAQYKETARFLSQTTFGKNLDDIAYISNFDKEAWINEQIGLPNASMLELILEVYDNIADHNISLGANPNDFMALPSTYYFNVAWWQRAIDYPDQLRQRVALALSEILVVSHNSILTNHSDAVANYYDIFLEEAFGNYENILRRVTLHPAMGVYLSHYNNPRANEELGTHPDENYAREVMQLFSIGLYELNLDGTRKLDDDGDFIATYSQTDIQEFAKVFTGLSASGLQPQVDWTDEPYFGISPYAGELTLPMSMYEAYHEPGPKYLLNGFELSGNDDGMTEVVQAVNHLFNHENVGPFISYRLIQHLVKSNPSPAYVARVASAFNNNGNGVRGDMEAVVKAILLDDEARNCNWISDNQGGKLKEPIVRYTEYFKGNEFNLPSGYLWNNGYNFGEATDQYPLLSPSVFNFYTPFYTPNGEISDAGLVAPEFQILQTRTSVGFINWAYTWTQGGFPYWQWEPGLDQVTMITDDLLYMARDPEVLINHLDMIYCNGNMTSTTREIISDALYEFDVNVNDPDDWRLEYRAELGLYLTLISPDFSVLR